MRRRWDTYRDIEEAIFQALRRAPWFVAYVQALARGREFRAMFRAPRYRATAAGWDGDRYAEPGTYRTELRVVQVRRQTRTRPRTYALVLRSGDGVLRYSELVMN